MHHKRKRPKSTRAGCLMCKPWKRQGTKLADRCKWGDHRKQVAGKDDLRRYFCE